MMAYFFNILQDYWEDSHADQTIDAYTPMSAPEDSKDSSTGKLSFLEDVSQSLQVELARKEIPLKTIMTWKKDTIVEFETKAGESVEVLIGEKLIARGEVVVINDRFGVRISEITHPSEHPGGTRQ